MDSKWRTVREFELHWRAWGNEYVVYHGGSGDTHLLDEIGARALQCLQKEEATPIQLCRRLAAAAGLETDTALLHKVRKMLEQYQQVGLVESVRR